MWLHILKKIKTCISYLTQDLNSHDAKRLQYRNKHFILTQSKQNGCCDSSVGVARSNGLHGGISIPSSAKLCSSAQRQTDSWTRPTSYPIVFGGFSPESRTAEELSWPMTILCRGQEWWSCTSIFTEFFHGHSALIMMHWNNFTLLYILIETKSIFYAYYPFSCQSNSMPTASLLGGVLLQLISCDGN
jgi:hypothetical protein